MSEFMRVIPSEDAIVTHDSGSPRDQLLPFYVAKKPRGYLGWGKSHQLGTGLGSGDRRQDRRARQDVRQFHGRRGVRHDRARFRDRGAQRHPDHDDRPQQLDDGDRDARDGAVARAAPTRDLGGNYANLATDLGGWGERVTDPGEVAGAIQRARRVNDSGRAALLEFITSRRNRILAPPRRGVAAYRARRNAVGWADPGEQPGEAHHLAAV